MKQLLIILSLSLVLSGCSSLNRNVSNLVFPPHPNSDQRKGKEFNLSYPIKQYRPEIRSLKHVNHSQEIQKTLSLKHS